MAVRNCKTSAARAAVLALLVVLSQARVATAQELPSRPADYVVDLAGVIDRGTFQKLNGYLKELEQKTTAQMIVLTVDSTGAVPIRDFALQTAEKWKLGRKDRSNGVLIVIAIKDRQWTFEVGYGLEATLPDAFCGRIGRDVFVPHFKQGDYSGGIYAGALVLLNKVAGGAGVTIGGAPPEDEIYRSERLVGRLFFAVFMIVVVAVLSSLFGRGYYIYRNRRYTQGLWPWLLLGGMSSEHYGHRNWGGGWGGGGFGGSGFGGGSFGGGGGGSFGGGGASGGW